METTGLKVSSNKKCKLELSNLLFASEADYRESYVGLVRYLLLNRRRRQGLYRRLAQNAQVKTFVQGMTAAVGAIAGAAIILSKRALMDWTTMAIAVISPGALLGFRKLPERF